MKETIETIEIDGDSWEISAGGDLSGDYWIGVGISPRLRGCIVTARTREALVGGIPATRDKHEMATHAMRVDAAIVAAFKEVLDQEAQSRYIGADRREQIEKTRALCAELWPWLFKDEE